MPNCSIGELYDRVVSMGASLDIELPAAAAFDITQSLMQEFPGDEQHVPPAAIVDATRAHGIDVPEPEVAPEPEQAEEPNAIAPEMSMDPAEVLLEVYKVCQRCLPKQEGQDHVFMPRIGRAPKESVFYDEELRAEIDALPDEVKVLIGGIDLYKGEITVTLYDEANDVDRTVGPIDMARYEDEGQLSRAIEVLLNRLPFVLAADFN